MVMLILISQSCTVESGKSDWKPAEGPLFTRWSGELVPENILPEYPRPQLERTEWLNLNGLWDYAIVPSGNEKPLEWDGKILVPFAAESALSGVKREVGPENRLWYHRQFEIPASWKGKQILLNFGASDWETKVWINGTETGYHRGGYDAFTFDITDALTGKTKQEILIAVWDPVDQGTQPRGKQVLHPHGIWYTSVTGIWQTVWIEPVNSEYIKTLRIVPDIDQETVTFIPGLSQDAAVLPVKVEIFKDNETVIELISDEAAIVLPVKDPVLWSPGHPFLYTFRLEMTGNNGEVTDRVAGYFGMRKISLGEDEKGFTRIMLNDEFIFQFGPLDQGWWPDGLYTAPTDEALKYDIEVTKKLGFNMIRKHVKIEPERWYYWCDRLGILVWQDMPSGDQYIGHDDPDITRSEESEKQFKYELTNLVKNHFNHPSIIIWVPFNEGWGQFKTGEIVDFIRKLDTTRLVNPASGWADRKAGDIRDIHAYPGPAMPEPEDTRAIVLGEFGGLGLPLEGHTWQEKDNWGYRNYTSQDELMEAYSKLIMELMPMADKGLSAAVYTQTTDVEIEVNGLMTYDRAVIKMDPEKLFNMNRRNN
ncbi:MAG: beta-galactosidase [Bacteroides sp. SM23_62_1]|nr:MAG: beta-galactosidase [Bacteroides sp. SM23_62_1]